VTGGARFPLAAREAAELFRRGRTYALQGAFLAALWVILAASWPSGVGPEDASGASLFRLLAGILLAAAALVAPALAAPMIIEERERETLGLLAIAGASPARIVLGKAAGRLAHVLVLAALAAPLAGSLYALGGLGLGEVLPVFVEAAALALLGTGLGAALSAGGRRAEAAITASIAAMTALAFLPGIAAQALPGFPARHISPVEWTAALFDAYGVTGETRFRLWWIAPLAHGALGALLLAVACLRLARAGVEPIRSGEGAARRIGRISLVRWASGLLRRALALVLRRDERRAAVPGFWSRRVGPVAAALLARERNGRALSDGALFVGLMGLVVLFEVLAPPGQAARVEARRIGAIALSALATLIASVMGAVAVARERDASTLEPLAAAPIDAEHFLKGKLLGISRAIGIAGLAVVVHVALGAVRGDPISGTPDLPWALALALLGTLPVGLALHAVIGLSISCHWESAVKASALSVAVAVLLAAVSKYVCLFYGISPVAFTIVAFDPAANRLGDPTKEPLQWIAIAVAAAIHAAAVGVVAWNHLHARFDQLMGRAALDIVSLPDTISEP